MNPILSGIGRQYTLYDADYLDQAEPELFQVQTHRDSGRLRGHATGRGEAWFLSLNAGTAVLRHYHRGGWMRILGDRYLWTGLENTRALREWRLLAKLHRLGLPVPRPMAALVVRRGVFYRADIIIAMIENSRSLASNLQQAPLSPELWRRVGRCIREIHEADVYHADLNAHNILLDAQDKVYLIDFDRGRLRANGRRWKKRNLSRLMRSLIKLKNKHHPFAFNEKDFNSLQEGYVTYP
ncbi:MAG: 3-deoxy-D-manno-octulosonic acid kinase [Gammaproteobacteria bacterium]|nr:3-deoxy-D-manno-octulosonic acid kinase [Gammaproteobacteria bacterium]